MNRMEINKTYVIYRPYLNDLITIKLEDYKFIEYTTGYNTFKYSVPSKKFLESKWSIEMYSDFVILGEL